MIHIFFPTLNFKSTPLFQILIKQELIKQELKFLAYVLVTLTQFAPGECENKETTEGAVNVKNREVLRMKLKKYCQFERTADLQNLLQSSDAAELLNDLDSDGKSRLTHGYVNF
jgi:hypothetical protein